MASPNNNIDGGAGGLAILQFLPKQLDAIKAQCGKYKKNPKGYRFGVGGGGGGVGGDLGLGWFWNQFYAWDNFVLGLGGGPVGIVTIEQTIHIVYDSEN